jgi:hypothetical protein
LIQEIEWNGETITQPGIYKGIPIETYHNDVNLLDGPSVSKSALKYIMPAMGGSPKEFYARWACNPNRIPSKKSDAMVFGKAVHSLLLGDECFSENFAIRPETYPDDESKKWSSNANSCKAWLSAMADAGREVITKEQFERIKLMHSDAAQYPPVQNGCLNGRVERSMFWKCEDTGIWMKSRPDVIPDDCANPVDLKSVSDLSERFLTKQVFDSGYFLQAGMTSHIAGKLGMPFESFSFLYVLNDEVPDTILIDLSDDDIRMGEEAVTWSLHKIRKCIDNNDWQGRQPFGDGSQKLNVSEYNRNSIRHMIELEPY